MSVIRLPPDCFGCGRVGVTKKNCPQCTTACTYCKKTDHRKKNCPKLWCSTCQKYDHRPTRCPSRTSSRQLAISWRGPQHNDQAWRTLASEKPSTVEAVALQPDQTFPDLRLVCQRLLQLILDGNVKGANHPGPDGQTFADHIQKHGGRDAVASELVAHIDPKIRALRGTALTREILDNVRDGQQDQWPVKVGYLDYVTDSRSPSYFRLYVGQSGDRFTRIMNNHVQAVIRAKSDSLHYFIVWIGNGYRSANFLRLWSFPEGDDNLDEDWYHAKSDLLELLFCIALKTLSLSSILESNVPVRETLPSCFGLNVMTPMYQNRQLLEMQKLSFIEEKQASPDPQISYWATHRKNRGRQHKRAVNRPFWTAGHFIEALREAIGPEYFAMFERATDDSVTSQGPALQLRPQEIAPHGNYAAPVGFLLDFMLVAGFEQVEAAQAELHIPWALRNSGFNAENSLMWTTNFFEHSILSPLTTSFDFSDEATKSRMQRLHRTVLDASGVKVLLLCGPRSVNIILDSMQVLQQSTLKLRSGFEYQLYVVQGHLGQVRLCISCPELPARPVSVNTEHACKVSELLKFTASVTQTKNITPFFMETSTAIATLLRQAQRQKQGYPPVTCDTLDGGLRVWLARKGFNDTASIKEIETIAGSLTRGLMMLLCCLKRCPDQYRLKVAEAEAPPSMRGKIDRTSPFDAKAFQAMKEYYSRVSEKNDQERRRLLDLASDRANTNGADVEDEAVPMVVDPSAEPENASREPQAVAEEQDFATPASAPDELSEGGNSYNDTGEEEANVDMAPDEPPDGSGSTPSLGDQMMKNDEQFEEDDDPFFEEIEDLISPEDTADILHGPGVPEIELWDEFSASRKPSRTLRVALGNQQYAQNWWAESTCFRNKIYLRKIPRDRQGRKTTVCMWYCELQIPDRVDFGDGNISISIELMDDGEEHPSRFAKSATDQDLSLRLGFRISGRSSENTDVTYFPQVSGWRTAYIANTFADILLRRPNLEEIAETPRRYLKFRKGDAPFGLERFEGGGDYTSYPEN